MSKAAICPVWGKGSPKNRRGGAQPVVSPAEPVHHKLRGHLSYFCSLVKRLVQQSSPQTSAMQGQQARENW